MLTRTEKSRYCLIGISLLSQTLLFAQTFYVNAQQGLEQITIVDGTCSSQLIGPFTDASTGNGIGTGDLAMCENGLIYIMDNTTFWEIDPATAQGTAIGTAPETLLIVGMGCDGNGNVYMVGQSFAQGFASVLYVVDVNTGAFTFLGFLPFQPSGDLVLANGIWYMTAIDGLVELDVDDPANSTLLYPGIDQVAVTVYPEDCNTLLVGENSQLSTVDLETGAVTPLCNTSQFIGGLTTIEEFNPLPTDCETSLDLDEDDSSGALNADFNTSSANCPGTIVIPIADDDLSVSATSPIDQMTVFIGSGILDVGFEVLLLDPQPGIQVAGSGTEFLTLTNLGGSDSEDFAMALSAIRYQNNAPAPSPGLRTVLVNFGTVDFQSSNIATAFIEIQDSEQAIVALGPDQFLCPGASVTLDAGNAGANYQWSNSLSSQIISVSETGTYSVTVSNDSQCPGSDEVVVLPADSNLVQLTDSSCDPAQVGVFTQTLTNQFGCDSTVVTTVSLVDADTTLISEQSCDPGQVGTFESAFTNQLGCDSIVIQTVSLLPSDETLLTESSCDPAQVGVFTQTLTNQFGCDSTVVTTVSLVDADTTLISEQSCDPTQVGTFESAFTNQLGCDSIVIQTVSLLPSDETLLNESSCDPAQVGVFTQTLTNQFGCDSTVVTTVSLVDADTTLISEQSCDPGQVGTFESAFTNQLGCDSIVIQTVSLLPSDETLLNDSSCDPAQVGVFTQTLTNQFGCDSTVVTTVGIAPPAECEEPQQTVFAPTAFSPDNDGTNDRFILYGEPNSFVIEELRIFTRWGESVFLAFDIPPNDLTRGWDGTHRGRALNAGVFVYWANVRFADGKRAFMQGDITLMR